MSLHPVGTAWAECVLDRGRLVIMVGAAVATLLFAGCIRDGCYKKNPNSGVYEKVACGPTEP
jgi:hypothetical protein